MGIAWNHRCCWQFWIWQNFPGFGTRQISEPSLGRDFVYGNYRFGPRKHIMSSSYVLQDSFYKVLTPAQHEKAFRNEFDFDSPDAIDFDVLVDRLKDLKEGYVI